MEYIGPSVIIAAIVGMLVCFWHDLRKREIAHVARREERKFIEEKARWEAEHNKRRCKRIHTMTHSVK